MTGDRRSGRATTVLTFCRERPTGYKHCTFILRRIIPFPVVAKFLPICLNLRSGHLLIPLACSFLLMAMAGNQPTVPMFELCVVGDACT
jgi:hypothetical protein